MSSTLKDNVSSDYFRAANSMTSSRSRRRIVAYVESYDDIYFWRTVFTQFEDETRYFEVMLPSKVKLERGKKSVLMNFVGQQVGPDMVACVDADYDYLMQGATPLSRKILSSPYVLHTYVYAIENYQCYAPAMHDVCVMATLNDKQKFDFQKYFADFSRACFPLFAWNVWAYRNGLHGKFSISDFNRITDPGRFTTRSPQQSIVRLQRKVHRKIVEMKRAYPDHVGEVAEVEADLKRLGVMPDRTYLYMQGHHIFDVVTAPILNKVCNLLRSERQDEIYRSEASWEQKRNELASYAHSQQDAKEMLKRHVGFRSSAEFQRLQGDVRQLLEQQTTEMQHPKT